MQDKFVLIVDAYSTGAELAPKLRARGVASIHVQSTQTIPADFLPGFRPDDFTVNIVYRDLPDCLARIEAVFAGAKPSWVMAGTETAVELADLLAAQFGLPGNPVASSRSRRDKYDMARALAKAGLATPACLRTDDLQALLDWAGQRASWPIVVKPLASAGNDNVFFCNSPDQLRSAFGAMFGQRNRMGEINTHVLAQTFLRGTQYVVNSVSIDGQHYFSDIWIDRRKVMPGASNIYDCEELLAATGEVQNRLTGYMRKVLDALELRNGPAHSEVMMTELGPVLIETGARLQGSMLEQPVIDALGASQITLAVERCCDPQAFLRRLSQPYTLTRHVMCVALISNQAGIVDDVSGFEAVRKLASYACHFHTPIPGDEIRCTTDLFSIPGVVYLSHADQDVLRRDYDTIRALERAKRMFSVCQAEFA
ncbi:ATP-grasp domain-containing protein [Massilia cavernae]|uniref:ATP-grasp domain-containing protein n=1 Tax=Massilia cavernae TaxID=2320864 RepID=A0A418XRD9_9BURK|nr:ATP-grasp domain-containing protein [Massilia cavernae]RJG15051.1 ATP-grasp domain-containing protein [Massilia cavernae]